MDEVDTVTWTDLPDTDEVLAKAEDEQTNRRKLDNTIAALTSTIKDLDHLIGDLTPEYTAYKDGFDISPSEARTLVSVRESVKLQLRDRLVARHLDRGY